MKCKFDRCEQDSSVEGLALCADHAAIIKHRLDEIEEETPEFSPYHPSQLFNVIGPPLYEKYLTTLENTGRFVAAADSVGCEVNAVQRYRKANPGFEALCQQALERYRDSFYVAARQRAVDGVQKPIIGGQYRDEIVCYETVYSDKLLELFLKRFDPEFRTHKVVDHRGGLDVRQEMDLSSLSRDARRHLRSLLLQIKEDKEREKELEGE